MAGDPTNQYFIISEFKDPIEQYLLDQSSVNSFNMSDFQMEKSSVIYFV